MSALNHDHDDTAEAVAAAAGFPAACWRSTGMNDHDLLRPRALYEAIGDSLRERIFAHELPPGAALDEITLARGYGVSRTPVREALKVLAHEGLVAIEPRRGCCVAEFSCSDVRALFGVLELLEAFAVREAASRGPAADPLNYERLVESAGNRYAAEAVIRLREKLRLALGPTFGNGDAACFASIASTMHEALSRCDAAQAEAAWRIYAVSRRRLANVMEPAPLPIERETAACGQTDAGHGLPHPSPNQCLR